MELFGLNIKNFLTFRETKLSGLKIKKFLILLGLGPQNFSLKKSTPKKFFLMFHEMDISGPKIKKVVIFSQKKLFLYFGKQNFLA